MANGGIEEECSTGIEECFQEKPWNMVIAFDDAKDAIAFNGVVGLLLPPERGRPDAISSAALNPST